MSATPHQNKQQTCIPPRRRITPALPTRPHRRRKAGDPRAAKLAALPGVEVFVGDLMVHADVAAALAGVSRALLVSGAFSHDQFEVEAHFIEAAARANLEVTVRVSTGSALIRPGTKGAYGRTHHGLAAFIDASKYRVVDLCPDWFLSNFSGNAGEAKATGKISLPVAGDGPAVTMIDPRDVGTAAAAILLQPAAGLAPFLAKRVIEVHGASKTNLQGVAAALAAAAGYPIAINKVPRDAWAAALQGFGVPRVFAFSFLETVEQVDGVVPLGYEACAKPTWCDATSPELLAIGWRPNTLEQWANAPETKAVWAK
jgi:uncharacterized protein YbjT (DUF2867 family)